MLRYIAKNKSSHQVGYLVVLTSAVLAAMVHVLAKPMLDNGTNFEIHPIVLAGCVYIINSAFFTTLTKKSKPISSLSGKNLLLLMVIGVSEVLALVTYFFGLKESTAANASIFSNGEIVFSLLITMLIFKESLHKKEIGPFAVMVLGMILLPLSYDLYINGMVLTDLVFGDALIIISGIFYALDVLICRYLSDKIDSRRITQVTSVVSGSMAVAAIIVFHIPINIQLENLGAITFFAIGGTGFSTMLFLVALRLIGGIRTIILFSTNSVLGVIFAAIFLGETISIINWLSAGLTFGGVYLLRKRLGQEHHKESDQKSHAAFSKSMIS